MKKDRRGPKTASFPRAALQSSGASASILTGLRVAIVSDVHGNLTAFDAVVGAKAFVTAALRGSATWRLGAGHGPLDHFGWGAGDDAAP